MLNSREQTTHFHPLSRIVYLIAQGNWQGVINLISIVLCIIRIEKIKEKDESSLFNCEMCNRYMTKEYNGNSMVEETFSKALWTQPRLWFEDNLSQIVRMSTKKRFI